MDAWCVPEWYAQGGVHPYDHHTLYRPTIRRPIWLVRLKRRGPSIALLAEEQISRPPSRWLLLVVHQSWSQHPNGYGILVWMSARSLRCLRLRVAHVQSLRLLLLVRRHPRLTSWSGLHYGNPPNDHYDPLMFRDPWPAVAHYKHLDAPFRFRQAAIHNAGADQRHLSIGHPDQNQHIQEEHRSNGWRRVSPCIQTCQSVGVQRPACQPIVWQPQFCQHPLDLQTDSYQSVFQVHANQHAPI